METMRPSTVRSFDTVWREPAPRYEARQAPVAEPGVMEELRGLPRVVYVVAGGVAAAIMGALLGGAMHI